MSIDISLIKYLLCHLLKEAYSESGPKDAISKTLEDHTGKESDLSGLLKVLQEPGFDILESEYSLQTELHLVCSVCAYFMNSPWLLVLLQNF